MFSKLPISGPWPLGSPYTAHDFRLAGLVWWGPYLVEVLEIAGSCTGTVADVERLAKEELELLALVTSCPAFLAVESEGILCDLELLAHARLELGPSDRAEAPRTVDPGSGEEMIVASKETQASDWRELQVEVTMSSTEVPLQVLVHTHIHVAAPLEVSLD